MRIHHDHTRAMRAQIEDHGPSLEAIRDFMRSRDDSVPNSHPGIEGLDELMARHPEANREWVDDNLSYRPAPFGSAAHVENIRQRLEAAADGLMDDWAVDPLCNALVQAMERSIESNEGSGYKLANALEKVAEVLRGKRA